MSDTGTPAAGAQSGEGAGGGQSHSTDHGSSGSSPPPAQGGQGLTADQVREVIGQELKSFRDSMFATMRRGGQEGTRGGTGGDRTPQTPPDGDGSQEGAQSPSFEKMSKAELLEQLQESRGRLADLERRDQERSAKEATAEKRRFLDEQLGIHRSGDQIVSDKFAMADLLHDILADRTQRASDGSYLVKAADGSLRPFKDVLAEYGAQDRFKLPAGGEGAGGVEPGRTPRRAPAQSQEPDFARMSDEAFKKFSDRLAQGGEAGYVPGSL